MRLLSLVILGLLSAGQTHAQEFTTPLDVVGTLYDSYFLGAPPQDIAPYFSDDLTDRLNGQEIGVAQFIATGLDPITGHLDWKPHSFSIALIDQQPEFAQIAVSFKDAGVPTRIVLDVVLEQDNGWQIDHIAGKAGEATWCTNAIISMARPSPGAQ